METLLDSRHIVLDVGVSDTLKEWGRGNGDNGENLSIVKCTMRTSLALDTAFVKFYFSRQRVSYLSASVVRFPHNGRYIKCIWHLPCFAFVVYTDYVKCKIKLDEYATYITERKCYKNRRCLNGAICKEDFQKHSYTCECKAGYTGRHCETRESYHCSLCCTCI